MFLLDWQQNEHCKHNLPFEDDFRNLPSISRTHLELSPEQKYGNNIIHVETIISLNIGIIVGNFTVCLDL